jgi:tRNA C32,U32 (ribose-2'-O)-methylase TrmJ
MKKGCFIQSVVIVTILIAVAVYIIKYKLDDWLVKPGKELILTELSNNWEKETAYIKESVEKDSLKSLMKYYLENIKTMKEVVNLDEEIFLNELDRATEDSFITKKEISKLSSLLKKEQNEKSKID